MQRLLSIVLILIISICAVPALATGQSGKSIPPDVIQQLLNRPALPFDAPHSSPGDQVNSQPNLSASKKPPADDAPMDEILNYWMLRDRIFARSTLMPSTVVRQRMLEECQKNPIELEMLLPYLPDSAGAQDYIKNLLDADKASPVWGPAYQRRLEDWLRLNTTLYLSDLVSAASRARDDGNETVRHNTDLTALARLDWKSALPILQNLSGTDQPRTRTFAICVLYKHAIESGDPSQAEELRRALISIAESGELAKSARTNAAMALVTTEWSGRDEWYLSMLTNGEMWSLQLGQEDSPLFVPIAKDPDKWIPVMTELIASKNPDTRHAAVASLAQFDPSSARKESLMPLLPWLSDEKWALDIDVVASRRNVIKSLGAVQIPESIPLLISNAIDSDNSEIRLAAVEALGEYRDPRVAPALKIALEKEKEAYVKLPIVKSLIASGGLSDQEMTDDLETCVRLKCENFGLDGSGTADSRPLPANLLIGLFISFRFEPSDSFSRKVLDRISALQDTDPAVAGRMLAIASKWRTKSINADIIRRIAAGRADSQMIEIALYRAATLREIAASELVALTEVKGVNGAIGLVLIDDDLGMQDVLGSADKESIIAVLACARLAGKSLPIDRVSELFRRNDDKLSAVAERYLEADDGIDARHLLWARHADQAWVLGWKANSSGTSGSGAEYSISEKKLRDEVLKSGGPNEILAFFQENNANEVALRIWNDRAVLTITPQKDRYKEWPITSSQVKEIRDYITAKSLDQVRSPYNGCLEHCNSLEMVDVVREKGWRIAIQENGPIPKFPEAMVGLMLNLVKLSKSEDFKVGYTSAKDLPGLEVLFGDDKRAVTAVWKQGSDFRLLIQKKVDPEEIMAAREPADEDNTKKIPEEMRKQQLRVMEMERGQFTWYKFQDGKLGETTVAPQEFQSADDNFESIDQSKFPAYHNNNLRRASAGNVTILATTNDGLWKKVGQQAPVQFIAGGTYSDVVVDGAGHWAIAIRQVLGDQRSRLTVRINLQTGKEDKVVFGDGTPLVPIEYIASRDRILVYRQIQLQAGVPLVSLEQMREYLFLDAATGKVQTARGDFRVFLEPGERPLQPTGRPNEVWVAVPERADGKTSFGRYNTTTFTFDRLMTVPKFLFNSSNMWVDEVEGKLYIINGGDLIRLPLPPSGK